MLQRKEYMLQTESVDIVSREIEEFLTGAGVSQSLTVKNCLVVEEILLSWIDRNVSESFQLVTGYRYGKPVISLEAIGLPCNIFEQNDPNSSLLINNLLNSFGFSPKYSYINGTNTVMLSVQKRKENKLFQILAAIALAVVTGLIFTRCFPGLSKTVLTDVVSPLYSAAFKVLGFISGPLILLSVVWGIYGIGDASALNLVGKKLIIRFLFVIFLIAAATCLTLPLFRFEIRAASEGASPFKAVLEMLLDIIPPNITEPFASGNTLHIIFCAGLFGIAMLYRGKRVSAVADLVEQVYCIVQFLMEFISNLMPYFVFLVVLQLIMNGSFSVFTSVWKLFVLFVAVNLLLCGAFTAITSVKCRVSPLTVIRKSIPTFLIAITTASSAAAFSTNMETCEKKFGIDSSLCAFGVPLGMVIFKTATTSNYVLISFFFAKKYGVTVSPEWLVSVIFLSAMLSIATPPIAGGGMTAYIMLFSQLGLPDETLGIALSANFLFDFVGTAFNVYNLPLALIGVGSKTGKVKLETLRQKAD